MFRKAIDDFVVDCKDAALGTCTKSKRRRQRRRLPVGFRRLEQDQSGRPGTFTPSMLAKYGGYGVPRSAWWAMQFYSMDAPLGGSRHVRYSVGSRRVLNAPFPASSSPLPSHLVDLRLDRTIQGNMVIKRQNTRVGPWTEDQLKGFRMMNSEIEISTSANRGMSRKQS